MGEIQLSSKKMKGRKAIAMIELIFAIVIIGITLLSVPNLIYQASESGYTTMQQESIAAAASDLSLILSREWDESGTDPSIGSPILDTASSTNLGLRPGGRSRIFATGAGGTHRSASTTFDEGDMDDIDDADGVTGTVTLIDGTRDLIDINISIATVVDYITDTHSSAATDWSSSQTIVFNDPTPSSTATSNIKRVRITLTSNSEAEELSEKKIVFSAFSCNIGSYKLERRELP